MPRLFRYYPADFSLPQVNVIHMDLEFDIYDDHTIVSSRLTAKTRADSLSSLNLDAKDLEILSVTSDNGPVTYYYNRESSILTITFAPSVPPGTEFVLLTETVCHPTHNILEGLYYDVTPEAAPPQQITQCQQWGFRKLVPCIDDMTAKCTYTTTIVADDRYSHLISNGDVDEPWHRIDNGRARIRYQNGKTPMAPYLFFLGAGTWTRFAHEFEYPDGTTITLELLLPPGTEPSHAEEALAILTGSVLWVCLFTGPGCYEHILVRHRLYALSMQLNDENRSGKDISTLKKIRAGIQELLPQIITGYQYTGTVYREIAMQNSDFGGMENVGNTTITANKIMPFPHTTDSAYEYMIGVKVHEFYHNLNGSEVTGMTPFELWLNEAVTVVIETRYMAFLEGEVYTRLKTVLTLLAPAGGTFALDAGAASMPVEPEGFNDPNDLITSITYVKGPEFVMMVENLIGKELFARGLDVYHKRYRHGNATWRQWIGSMEEISGENLLEMAETWLHQKRYPDIRVKEEYDPDTRSYTLNLTQSGFGQGKPWTFPFRAALVDREGRDIVETTVRVSAVEQEIRFPGVEKPAFTSLNRGYSCYGKLFRETDDEALYIQAEKDPDLLGRFLAFYQIADREKMKILTSEQQEPSRNFMDLFMHLISNEERMAVAGGQFLTIFEGVDDINYAHHYTDLYLVRQKIYRALAEGYQGQLVDIYNRYAAVVPGEFTAREYFSGIKRRQVKNMVLTILSTLDIPSVHQLILSQLISSSYETDRLAAFSAYLSSSASDRKEILTTVMTESQKHPVKWESFLSVVGSTSSPDILTFMKRAETSDAFHIEQTTNQRGLYGSFALNRKISLETEAGRAYLLDILIRLTHINEFTTISLLRTFAAIDLMHENQHIPLIGVLVSIMKECCPERSPGVCNTIRRIILGSPVALASYEKRFGTIKGLRE